MTPFRRRFLLITNPIAGRIGRRLLEPVLAHLEQAGAVIRRGPSGDIEDTRLAVADAARAGNVDAVLVAGGDGTFRLVASQMLGSTVPVGLLPLGTGNVLAHELAIPRDPLAIAAMLTHGATLPLTAARANGAPFFLMAGAGFDGAVIGRLDHDWKHKIGKFAYVSPTLRALAAALPRLDVTVDGVHHSASWIVVANARCYGGAFVLVPHTHAFDAGLHAVLFQSRDRFTLARQLLALAQGRLLARADVRMLPCRHVTVRGVLPVAVQIDGDASGATPLDVTPSDETVQVIVPEAVARQSASGGAGEWRQPAAGT